MSIANRYVVIAMPNFYELYVSTKIIYENIYIYIYDTFLK